MTATALPSRGAARDARARVAAELRRNLNLTRREARDWHARLVHHDRLRAGRAVVDALAQAGR